MNEARDDEREALYALICAWGREILPLEDDPEFGGDVAEILLDRILARNHPEPEITEYRNVLSDGEVIISLHHSRFTVEKRRAAGPWVPVSDSVSGEGEQG